MWAVMRRRKGRRQGLWRQVVLWPWLVMRIPVVSENGQEGAVNTWRSSSVSQRRNTMKTEITTIKKVEKCYYDTVAKLDMVDVKTGMF